MGVDSRIVKRLLVVALALGLLVAWWQRGATKKGDPQERQAEASARADLDLRRARHDFSGLARALSSVAARTIGLVQVAGKVVDRASGLPIANAEVVFSGPAGESSVACDAQGRYQVELEPGFYRSYARAEGYVAVAQAAAERLPGPVSAAAVAMPREGIAPLAGLFRDQIGVNLSLSPGAILRGRVVDIEGRPISGAVVAAKGGGQLRVISGSDVSESDGSGAYQLQVPAGSIELEANHDDYAGLRSASHTFMQAGELREDHTLIMSAGCIVDGWVVDSNGARVPDGSFEQQITDSVYTPIGEIQDGRVRFASDTEGTYVLRAWPWKHAPTASKEYRCSEGDRYRDEVFVVPSAEPDLTGYVEGETGQRVPYAFVDLFALEAGGATQQERADASGEFGFFQVPGGAYQLSVYVPGEGATIEIIDVPSSGVPLRLGGTGSILGSVRGIEVGSMTMDYRCAFRLDAQEHARADALSMPVQTLLVPLDGGRFRIDDLPACPLQGTVRIGDIFESFHLDVVRDQEALLRVGDPR